jgi:peptidoglycan/xylan/chitin deacetylase (PgdA/CDA1 family)
LNVLAQDYIGSAPFELIKRLNLPGLDIQNMSKDRLQLGFAVSKFIKNRPMAQQMVLKEVLLPQFFDFDKFQPTKMMTLDEVRQCATLHELGAHSFNHASMDFESEEFFKTDLIKCKEFFVSSVKSDVVIYAFPNGGYRKELLRIPFDFGYQHVLLVGDLFSLSNSRLHNRFGFWADSSREVLFRAVGGLSRMVR